MKQEHNSQSRKATSKGQDSNAALTDEQTQKPKEIGGRKGPEPTRYGDWELGGKCVDF